MKYPFLKFILALNGLAVLICSFLCLGLCSKAADSERIVYIVACVIFLVQSIISFCFVAVLSDIEWLVQSHENQSSNNNK